MQYLNVHFSNVIDESESVIFALDIFDLGQNVNIEAIRLSSCSITAIHVVTQG